MLTRIEIDGFKSFTNLSMEFSSLTIIAGLNAVAGTTGRAA